MQCGAAGKQCKFQQPAATPDPTNTNLGLLSFRGAALAGGGWAISPWDTEIGRAPIPAEHEPAPGKTLCGCRRNRTGGVTGPQPMCAACCRLHAVPPE